MTRSDRIEEAARAAVEAQERAEAKLREEWGKGEVLVRDAYAEAYGAFRFAADALRAALSSPPDAAGALAAVVEEQIDRQYGIEPKKDDSK